MSSTVTTPSDLLRVADLSPTNLNALLVPFPLVAPPRSAAPANPRPTEESP